MPLTRGTWFSSAENGQRLCDAAFFSLEMLTTHRCTFSTASTTAVRRESMPACTRTRERPATSASTVRPIAIFPSTPSLRLFTVVGTAVVLFAIDTRLHSSRPDSGRPGSRHVLTGHGSRLGFGSVTPFPSLSPVPLKFPSFP